MQPRLYTIARRFLSARAFLKEREHEIRRSGGFLAENLELLIS
jgi:hypothetical protein